MMKIAPLVTSATSVSDLTTSLEADVKRLTADLKKVQESCVNFEGFSLSNNLRLVSVPESTEMPCTTDFISRLLKDVLAMDEKPLIDRSHRSLRPKLFIFNCFIFINIKSIHKAHEGTQAYIDYKQ